MVSSVISYPTNIIAKLSAIVNIRKYRGLHEGHHFILMAMEVHGAPEHDMDCFIGECARLFHGRQLGNHLSLFFCIQFLRCVNIILQHDLTFTIENQIALAGHVCFRTPIIIKSHDSHASDIRKAMGEITSYHERNYILFIFWFMQVVCFLAFLFCLPCDGSNHRSFIGFCDI